jgi:secretion/DNA translocation related TadE-like protein
VTLLRRDAETGSATVWLLCSCLLLLGLGSVLMFRGAAVVARHRASVVADLAALAAAQALLAGEPAPCLSAARVAAAQGGRVVACHLGQDEVHVLAEVPTGPLLAFLPPAQARARAGRPGSLPRGFAPRALPRARSRVTGTYVTSSNDGQCGPISLFRTNHDTSTVLGQQPTNFGADRAAIENS